MLEELIEKYIEAKQRYEKAPISISGMIQAMAAQSDYGDAASKLLAFIEKHSDILIAW